ncbi:MAG: pilus assembly protein PilP [Burkholderiaceae bacterium]|nr:pilus assembly protein PilP [Burkholderiaceae bacterium]
MLIWPLPIVLAAGCASVGVGELRQWVAQQRHQAVAHTTPVSKPKSYVPLPYTANPQTDPDPFSSQRLARVLERDTEGDCQVLIEKERNRRKEPLEAFPLDVMSMVGSLDRAGKRVALVKVDTLLYQVQAGNYLGQNYGLVTQVSESEVRLREIDQSGSRRCTERMASLQLQEGTK